jgi:hypothetical protein
MLQGKRDHHRGVIDEPLHQPAGTMFWPFPDRAVDQLVFDGPHAGGLEESGCRKSCASRREANVGIWYEVHRHAASGTSSGKDKLAGHTLFGCGDLMIAVTPETTGRLATC